MPAIRSGRNPSSVFDPSPTVTGRSVESLSVKQGMASADVSSCTPPESVRTSLAAASRARGSRGIRAARRAGCRRPRRRPAERLMRARVRG